MDEGKEVMLIEDHIEQGQISSIDWNLALSVFFSTRDSSVGCQCSRLIAQLFILET